MKSVEKCMEALGLWNSVLRELTTFEFIIISLMKTKHEKLKISKSYKSFLPSSSSLESLRRRDMAKEENTPAKLETTLSL